MKKEKRVSYCQLPSVGSVLGRSSSITNAFVNAIIPIVTPTLEQELEAFRILEMDATDIRCAYCNDKATEWDHLKAIIRNQEPTGYITELANLIPACGKCNQSKGKTDWRKWMLGPAKLSPKTRGIPDLDKRVRIIESYEKAMSPQRLDFEALAGKEIWQQHRRNWREVLDMLKKSQEVAKEIRAIIAAKHKEL